MTAIDVMRTPQSPVLVYLAGLGASSRPSQHHAVRTLAALLTDWRESMNEYQWQHLDSVQIGVLRSTLEENYAPATANRMLSALRGVLKACWKEGLLSNEDYLRLNDFRNVPGNTVDSGRMLEPEEIQQLAKSAQQTTVPPQAARDAAILSVIFEAGLRRSEVVALDLDDHTNGMLQIRRSKGGKTRHVPVVKASDRIRSWVTIRGDWQGPLFCPVGRSGAIQRRRLYHTSVPFILRRVTARAGIEPWVPHDGRRTYISMLLQSGSDLATAAALAGHTRVDTTSGYDRRPLRARIEAVGRLRVPV